ncbi:hypothetical protein HOLleu_12272 [Holothuria leucospilota]|uniref:Uncharacterized protein n=1 Tax=Holothuria leucospilota TaxID=206669 RepID=A0A9Q1CB14_HOLLE|nr:hypothetical protein HOLleu_12272 [Holothuria leucospilota]
MKVVMLAATNSTPKVRLFDTRKWGTLGKAVRLTGLVMRFVGKLKGKRVYPEGLSHDELTTAKLCLTRQEQGMVFGQELEALNSGKFVTGSPSFSN